MPEVSQYTFKHQEVLEALIKKAGLHEGKWQLSLSFGLSALNMERTISLASKANLSVFCTAGNQGTES